MAANGSFAQQDQYKSEQYTPTAGHTAEATSATANGSNNLEPSKDEVGWYFVEQYYTTLSRNPEKLHLFYGKRSQFVAGLEAELSTVSVGRTAIQERIKTLEFQDCKVRISNVDSQASDSNIVIQVIGEISNKSADLKKFVQTFVLAKQPTGYFVLNDVFRYVKEDLDEEVDPVAGDDAATVPSGHEQLSEGVEMPKAQEPIEEHKDTSLDADLIDKKLEETPDSTTADSTLPEPTNGDVPAPAVEETEDAPVAAATTDVSKGEPESVEAVEKAVEAESVKEPELPKEPVPSPALTRLPTQVQKPTAPAQPAAPPKTMSWANRAAAAAAASAPKPAVPVVTKTASPAPTATRAPPAPQAAQPAQSTPAPVSNKENEAPQQSGWQSVGSDHAKRQNRPQSVSLSAPVEKDNGTMAYLRNVTEAVKTEELRETLATYGELVYFDINRQKNCAFVEFATASGYQAAANANPHVLGGEEIMVEPRRPKSSAYGGAGYNGARGGLNNRGRGGFDAGRGGQRGRGDFGANRGRGTPRGRGGAPVTAA